MSAARAGRRLLCAVAALGLMLSGLAVQAAAEATLPPPYPDFRAEYEAYLNGFHIADAVFTLTRNERGEYLYRSESKTRGLARLFGTRDATESSRWRYTPDGIRVLEYRSLKPGGDADDNEHLVFDWKHHRVKNVSPLDPWSMELPAGTLDKMVMQLAMLFDLRNGKKVFEYRVPRQGRIKTYHWALVGEDVTELDDLGSFRTLKLMRTDDR
ncbi:MAG TPA: DUF3108 domain-containing protein, partial [Gammaproteobacteria bacterium]|nr:DUF3108 domain-containing protein [Gammaproteobacteria bacterium]